MNTHIRYAGSTNAYQDNAEVSILTGELTPAQIARLGWLAPYGDLTPLCEELGLARLRNYGSGIFLQPDRIVPTLEPATNARVDAARFYTIVSLAFARQIVARYGLFPQLSDLAGRVNDLLAGKSPETKLSRRGPILSALQPDRDRVAELLRVIAEPYVLAGVILIDPTGPLPPHSAISSSYSRLNSTPTFVLLPVLWQPTIVGSLMPAVVARAIKPEIDLTVREAREALAAVQDFTARMAGLLDAVR